MIDLYTWTTPNGRKVSIALEELGLPYTAHAIDISKDEQFQPDFLKIAPNNRMPAIVDHDPADGGAPIAIFESGAILLYLADKIGRFVGHDLRSRTETIQWLMWQMGGLGPMAGQNGHFSVYSPEKIDYAINRYVNETSRLYGVLNRRLEGRDFIAGDFSIADMACYPWVVPHEAHKQNLDDFPHLKRWFEAVKARPATVRAYAKGGDVQSYSAPMTEEQRKILFGQTANTAA